MVRFFRYFRQHESATRNLFTREDKIVQGERLKDIISLSESKLGLEDAEIEVEYQSETIGKYGLDFDGKNFVLTNQFTACLANDKCGIPAEKLKVSLSNLQNTTKNACTPGGKCC